MINRVLVPGRRIAQNPMLLGSLAAGTAAVCYGASQFMARQLVTDQAPPLVTATFALFMGMLVLAAFSHRGIRQDRRALKKGFLLMVLAGLSASAGVGFNYSALGLAPVVIVAPVSAGAPLISLFLAHIFLQRLEKVTLRIWLGAMLVVAGVIMVTLGSV